MSTIDRGEIPIVSPEFSGKQERTLNGSEPDWYRQAVAHRISA